MGNLVQQMAETAVTMSMKKTDWPRRQLGQMRPKRNLLLERQSGKRRSSTSNQDGQEQRLAPEAAQEAEEERLMHCCPLQNLAS